MNENKEPRVSENFEIHSKQRELMKGFDEEKDRPDFDLDQPLNDFNLSVEKVLELLNDEPEIDAQNLEVLVDGNYITLYGNISDIKSARAAVKLVENIPGVKTVINLINAIQGDDQYL